VNCEVLEVQFADWVERVDFQLVSVKKKNLQVLEVLQLRDLGQLVASQI
jgi:hypothetical protein